MMNTADEVRLGLSPQVLARLLAEKRLYADDFRCLDQQAKRRVKSMFLANLRLKHPATLPDVPARVGPTTRDQRSSFATTKSSGAPVGGVSR